MPNPSPAKRGHLLPRLAGALGAALALHVLAASSEAPPSASRYYLTRELDVRPGILNRVEPPYPEAALRRGLSGTVRVRLFINETGAVDRVETVRAEPPGYFEQSAERAFRAARFTPGKKGTRAVKSQMLIEVSFEAPPGVLRGAPR